MPHLSVTGEFATNCDAVFDLLHDYDRRCEWDTLLRDARIVDAAEAGVGVETVCTLKRSLGGLAFFTRYVTFERPRLAAVVLTRPLPLFKTFAASIRHRDTVPGRSELTYQTTFTLHARWWWLQPIATRMIHWETKRRLRSLAAELKRI